MVNCEKNLTSISIPPKARDGRLDAIKGFLILLVIMGHLLETNIESFGCNYLHNFIYLFHMPLFVFISGYVSNTSSKRFIISTIGLIEVYILYQILFSIGTGKVPDLSRPVTHLWYLPSLFVWRFIDLMTKNQDSIRIVIISLSLAILCGFIESISYRFTLSRMIVFSFFYFIGRLCREKDILSNLIYKIPSKYGYCFVILTLTALLFITNLGRVVYCSQPYTVLSDNIIIGCFIRILFILFTICLCTAIVISSKSNRIAGNIGKITLPIYVYHLGLVFVLNKLNKEISLPLNLTVFLFTAIIFIAIVFYSSKRINFNWLLHPITYYFENNKKVC